MPLWNANNAINETVLRFTVGDDYLLDMELIDYDCQASIAHARTLAKAGVLTEQELQQLESGLNELRQLIKKRKFTIHPQQEDMHTAIEEYLTETLGDVGKKIHTGRSRNDQVLAALRLFYKDHLSRIRNQLSEFREVLQAFAEQHQTVPLPGYTHTRKAMPFSVAQWAGAFADAMSDNERLVNAVLEVIDQSPLGSGAGYGVPLELDREFTARELGFARVQSNPLYVQNSRGKFEAALLHTFTQISMDLNRLASDLIFFTQPELDFFSLSDDFVTGSSIMPHKKNPDVLELMRAYHHRLMAAQMEVQMMVSNLISGYHRDYQLTKKPVLESVNVIEQLLTISILLFRKLTVNEAACRKAMTEELFATEKVYQLVQQGVPFREAYRTVAKAVRGKPASPPADNENS